MQLSILDAQIAAENTNKSIPGIEKQEFEARTMSLDEAILQMELLQNDVLVFIDPKNNHLHVLYRKANNQIGLIETVTSN